MEPLVIPIALIAAFSTITGYIVGMSQADRTNARKNETQRLKYKVLAHAYGKLSNRIGRQRKVIRALKETLKKLNPPQIPEKYRANMSPETRPRLPH